MHEDLLARLAETPARLAQLVVEASDDALDAAAEGEWSPRVILAHLKDNEWMLFRLRLERILAEDSPQLAAWDTGRWALGRNRDRDRREHLLADFALQRQATLGILRPLARGDWQRAGRRSSGGELTVEALVRHYADHDAEHVAQLEQALGSTLDEVLRRRYHPPH